MSDPDRRANADRLRLRTRSPEETRAVGGALAAQLRAGDVVALTGELGAGKTCIVQGAAAALGVTERVTSPSFLLRRDYRGRVPIIHLDVYRLDTLQEVLDIGYDEVADGEGVTFIEWGDAMAPLLPADYLEVDLRLGDPMAPAGAAVGAPQTTAGADPHDGDGPDAAAAHPAADGLAEMRTLELRAHGADWRRRMAGLSAALAPWADGEGG